MAIRKAIASVLPDQCMWHDVPCLAALGRVDALSDTRTGILSDLMIYGIGALTDSDVFAA